MRKTRKLLPSAAYLRECLYCDADNGILYWKRRPLEHFQNKRACNIWNSRYAYAQAFCTQNRQGYFVGTLDDDHYLAHRIIWKHITGEEPALIIDHIDRNPVNNRFVNFRTASKSQNNINSTVKKGIWYDSSRGKWQAYVKLNGKKIHLGRHDLKRQAIAARRAGVEKYFGAFAP